MQHRIPREFQTGLWRTVCEFPAGGWYLTWKYLRRSIRKVDMLSSSKPTQFFRFFSECLQSLALRKALHRIMPTKREELPIAWQRVCCNFLVGISPRATLCILNMLLELLRTCSTPRFYRITELHYCDKRPADTWIPELVQWHAGNN